MTAQHVIVGVDGSPGSVDALRWAYDHAQRTGAVLHLFTVFRYEDSIGVLGARWPVDSFEEIQVAAARRQEGVRAQVLPEDAAARSEVVFGNAVERLLDRAATADLLVLGRRGLGGFKGLLLGSVSQQCIQHAACPVTVVPTSGQ